MHRLNNQIYREKISNLNDVRPMVRPVWSLVPPLKYIYIRERLFARVVHLNEMAPGFQPLGLLLPCSDSGTIQQKQKKAGSSDGTASVP